MSRLDKLKEKFLNPTSTITYNEAAQLLKWLNFIEDNKGKTSGSRVCFFRESDVAVIMLHKPHPDKELKSYAKRNLVKNLQERGDL